jgi:hypothetical protein
MAAIGDFTAIAAGKSSQAGFRVCQINFAAWRSGG